MRPENKDKTIQQMVMELLTTSPKGDWLKDIIAKGEPGDTLYQVIGKDYMRRYGQQQSHNTQQNHKMEPRVVITTIPGTIGVHFDKWLADGWTCANMIDEKHPDGQDRALEALRGINEIGAPANDMRDLKLEELSPQQAKYFSTMQDRYRKWLRTKQ